MSVPNPPGRAASSLTNEGAAQRKGLRGRGCGEGTCRAGVCGCRRPRQVTSAEPRPSAAWVSTSDTDFTTGFLGSISGCFPFDVFFAEGQRGTDKEGQEGRTVSVSPVPISLPSRPHVLFPGPEPPVGQGFPSDGPSVLSRRFQH